MYKLSGHNTDFDMAVRNCYVLLTRPSDISNFNGYDKWAPRSVCAAYFLSDAQKANHYFQMVERQRISHSGKDRNEFDIVMKSLSIKKTMQIVQR